MKKITEKTFLTFRFLSSVSYSPDGKKISFLVRTSDYEHNRNLTDLYLIREDKKTYRLTDKGNVTCYTWTQEGSILYVPGDIKGKTGNLCLYTLDPAEAEELPTSRFVCELEGKGISNLQVMSKNRIAFMAEHTVLKDADPYLTPIEDREKIYLAFDEIPTFKNNKGVQSGKRNGAYIADVGTGEVRLISDPLEHVTFIDTNEDTMLVGSCAYKPSGVKEESVSFYCFKFAAGNDASITGDYMKIMDRSELMCRNCEVTGRLWNGKVLVLGSKGEKYGIMQSPDAWVIDLETLNMEKLFPNQGSNVAYRVETSDAWSGEGAMKAIGNRFYFTNTRQHSTYLRYFGPDGVWSEDLTPYGSCGSFDVHGDNIAYMGLYGMRLSEIYENGVRLTDLNEHVQKEYLLSTPERLTFSDADGYEIEGWVMKPIGYEPGKKYPAILDIHGGPRSVYGEGFFHEHQMWTNDGYFVMYCNPRGGEGNGDDFADCWGERMGVVDYYDIMQFIDVSLEKYPAIDEKHMGVLGVSYGGFMTNWIIGHTDRFAAACTSEGISDWTSLEYATAGIGWYWVRNFLKTTSKEDHMFLWDKSPLKYAPLVKTPTLFIHANEDNVCWQDQGFEMYTAIKLAGTDARLCYFKREGHTFARTGLPVHRLARMEEIHSWMDRYLK